EDAIHAAHLRHPTWHVLVALAVDGRLGHEAERRRPPAELDHHLGEAADRRLLLRADVDDLSRGAAEQSGRNRGAHRVVDEGEAAGLAPVTDHGEGLPTQDLPEDDRDNAYNVQEREPRPGDDAGEE